MLYTTRIRLVLSFLGISLLLGGISLFVGGELINRTLLGEAHNRVNQDLNAAREIYQDVGDRLSLGLRLLSQQEELRAAIGAGDREAVRRRLWNAAGDIGMDFAGLVDPAGQTVCRLAAETADADGAAPGIRAHPAARMVLEKGQAVCGTLVMESSELAAEDATLAERARIELIPTPRATPRPAAVETRGMTVSCAVPVCAGDRLLGVLYGGTLLNRSETIVDRVRDTAFRGEVYQGKSIGTATIFLNDVRVSTNVRSSTGDRAVGTRVSEEVKQKVLDEGQCWTAPAFVVYDWYISAYEPIRDIGGSVVGILYVGVLEAKYQDLRRRTLRVFGLITSGGIVVATVLGFILGQAIWRPVHDLIEVSHRVSAGDLSATVGPISCGDIGVLQRTFHDMLSSLRERDKRQRAESERKLLQSEKQASIGRLAAGVAHEINNPLTGVLTFTHMLLRRQDLSQDIRADLQTIAAATERVRKIVKGLLDFSRQTALASELTSVNDLIQSTLALVANEALVKGVELRFEPASGLPMRTLDRSQFQGVLMNILLNALDATAAGGVIQVSTGIGTAACSGDRRGIEITISDTGCGIPAENLDRIFDPFFTTKEVGKGTGLGLAVSQGIVERHGGSIHARSEVGKGTIFVVWLPVEDSA